MRRWCRLILIGCIAVVGALVLWIGVGVLAGHAIHGGRPGRPTTAEVERSIRGGSRSEGEVSQVGCHQITGNAWDCRVKFVDGRVVREHARWYQSDNELGVSVIQRISP